MFFVVAISPPPFHPHTPAGLINLDIYRFGKANMKLIMGFCSLHANDSRVQGRLLLVGNFWKLRMKFQVELRSFPGRFRFFRLTRVTFAFPLFCGSEKVVSWTNGKFSSISRWIPNRMKNVFLTHREDHASKQSVLEGNVAAEFKLHLRNHSVTGLGRLRDTVMLGRLGDIAVKKNSLYLQGKYVTVRIWHLS